MKAAVFHRYGKPDVLTISEVPDPVPGTGEVLIKVHAAGLNPKDTAIRYGATRPLSGFRFPKLTGSDFAGEIVSTGSQVNKFQAGDRVFGYLPHLKGGAVAELVTAKSSWLGVVPKELSFETAAAIPCAYLTALQGLRDLAGAKAGQKLCVYGASGGVGTAALQLGRAMGLEVHAIASSRNRAYCLEQGADFFHAYDEVDYRSIDETWDIYYQVFMHGGLVFKQVASRIRRGGHFLQLLPRPDYLIWGFFHSLFSGRHFHSVIVKARGGDLNQLGEMSARGEIHPRISEVISLSEIQKGHEMIQTNHVRGKIVVKI